MRIAVLGWGSLVWDPRGLKVAGDWLRGGPVLPVEFSRISDDGRLTLVIDETVGTHCATRSAVSAIANLDEARKNLQEREGIDHINGVGFVDLASGTKSNRAMERHPYAVETIRTWAGANGHDAAIWTALASNFHKRDKANEQFSVEAAIQYLDRIDKVTFARALHYVWNAPPEVQTPVRAAVNIRWPEG